MSAKVSSTSVCLMVIMTAIYENGQEGRSFLVSKYNTLSGCGEMARGETWRQQYLFQGWTESLGSQQLFLFCLMDHPYFTSWLLRAIIQCIEVGFFFGSYIYIYVCCLLTANTASDVHSIAPIIVGACVGTLLLVLVSVIAIFLFRERTF